MATLSKATHTASVTIISPCARFPLLRAGGLAPPRDNFTTNRNAFAANRPARATARLMPPRRGDSAGARPRLVR
jgi:hypothetical protein